MENLRIRCAKLSIGVMKARTIVVIGALLLMIFILLMPWIRTRSISEYIRDGGSFTCEMVGYGSRLTVRLTSTDDYMHVKIIVDGIVVFEDKKTYEVDFERTLGFGYHIVHIVVENSMVFGLGSDDTSSG